MFKKDKKYNENIGLALLVSGAVIILSAIVNIVPYWIITASNDTMKVEEVRFLSGLVIGLVAYFFGHKMYKHSKTEEEK